MVDAGRRYLRACGFRVSSFRLAVIGRGLWDAATLRYMRGGGDECYYPKDDTPSSSRRLLHYTVAAGFGLCIVSTVSAGVLQDILRHQPPYALWSVPVVSGTVGGVALVVGCCGLASLKRSMSGGYSAHGITVKDYGLLFALAFLAVTGLATLIARDSPAFGIVFLIHLTAVIVSFVAAPYSKFIHVIFRSLAVIGNVAEDR
jgi:citrate/tricarballylate utilization protein